MKKGDCYIVAGHYIVESKANNILLCHGIVSGRGKLKGLRIGHAWIEMGDVVLDHSNWGSIVMRKEQYYKIGEIKELDVKKYAKAEAIKLMLKTKHYGSWE